VARQLQAFKKTQAARAAAARDDDDGV